MNRYARELSVAGAWVILLVVLAVLAPGFFQLQPLLSLATREVPTLLVVCGMVPVILARQIDISVGSQFSVCSVIAGLGAAAQWPLAAVVVAALATGAALGLINAVFVAGLRLPSIVVTLATMVTLRQGLNLVRQGEFVNLPAGVQWFGLSQAAGQLTLVVGAGAVAAVLAWGLHGLAAGRFVYAVGSDAEAARLAGISPGWVTCNVFVVLGMLTGLAAVTNIVQSPQVQPLTGSGLELKVIAAVVVGGVAISGGRGRLVGAVLGLLLLACIPPALVHLRIEAYWEKALQGLIIILAVMADGWKTRGEGRR
ncbi:MAG: ABC transporter permease [Opitutaceae bacterium]|nr:ABC transporter permease [Opitutaceae bacterium]